MSELPNRDQVVADLPELADIRPAIVAAWNRWAKFDPADKKDITDSARAAVVHSFIISEATKNLGGAATVYNRYGLVVFEIRGYAIRFKKHDEQLLSRNQETRQVRDFMGQQPLEGVPSVWNLEAGYVLDRIGSSIVSTNVVCPNGFKNEPYWHIELHEQGYELSAVHDLFAPENQPEQGEPQGSRWRRRDSGVIIPFSRGRKIDG